MAVSPTGSTLRFNPPNAQAGKVVVNQYVDIAIVAEVWNGESAIEIPSFTVPTCWAHHPSNPGLVTVEPGFPYTYTFRFTPTAAQTYSGFRNVWHTGINSPLYVSFTGEGINVGSPGVTITPSEWTFEDTKVLQSSEDKIFTIRNTGDTNLDVTAIVFAAPFAEGTVPKSDTLPHTLLPGDTLTFSAKFTPSGEGLATDADAITVTISTVDYDIKLSGTGYLIEPVNEVTGGVEKDLLCFFGEPGSEASQVLMMDHNDLDNEEEGVLERVTHLGQPGVEKSLCSVFVRYEDIGVATITLWGITREAAVSKTVTIGTVIADGAILMKQIDLVISGEVVDFKITREALSGPVSIIGLIFKFAPWEALLGTYLVPDTVAAAHVLASAAEYTLLCFADDNDLVSVKQADPADWNTEEDCVIDKRTVLSIISQVGLTTQLKYLEKTVMRFLFKYEDYGPATVTILVHVKRRKEDYIERRDVQIGTTLCDNWVRTAFADLEITGEMLEFSIVRKKGNGPVCITEYSVKFNPAGELMEHDL